MKLAAIATAITVSLCATTLVVTAPSANAAAKTFSPSITKIADKTLTDGENVIISGKVTPASKAKSAKVTIQVRKSGSSTYKTAKTITLSKNAKFSKAKVKVSGVGTWYYRLCKPAAKGYKAKCTSGIKVTVTPKTKTTAVPFTTVYTNDATMFTGTQVVTQKGKDGTITKYYKAGSIYKTVKVDPVTQRITKGTKPIPPCTTPPSYSGPATSPLQGGATATINGCDMQNVTAVKFLSWYYINPMETIYVASTGQWLQQRKAYTGTINEAVWPVPGRNMKAKENTSVTVTIPQNLADIADVRVYYKNGTVKKVGTVKYSANYAPALTQAQKDVGARVNALRASGYACPAANATVTIDSNGNIIADKTVWKPSVAAMTVAPKLSDLAQAYSNDYTQRASQYTSTGTPPHVWLGGDPDGVMNNFKDLLANDKSIDSSLEAPVSGEDFAYTSYTDVLRSFLSSSAHCGALMNSSFKYIGVGLGYGTGTKAVVLNFG